MRVDALIEETEVLVDALLDAHDPMDDCPLITFKQPRGTFPNTLTIDFGDNCVGPYGHVRKGSIVVEISAPLDEAGASRSITTVDFMIDGLLIVGSTVLTNQGYDADQNVSFSRFTSIQFYISQWIDIHLDRELLSHTSGRRTHRCSHRRCL